MDKEKLAAAMLDLYYEFVAGDRDFATDNNVGGKWIPVTERLPRCGERVLVTDGTAVFEVHLSISHKWVRGGLCWMDGEVTHWMPLPEPPMRKGENE